MSNHFSLNIQLLALEKSRELKSEIHSCVRAVMSFFNNLEII